MAHSPAYFTAAGVRDHAFGWEHASQEKIDDPVIHVLIDKVKVGPPPAADVEHYRQGATVTLELVDGRTFSNTVFSPKGAGYLGIDWSDVEVKYRALTPSAPLSESQIASSFSTIRNLREMSTVGRLMDEIRILR